jgi:hypothetical protein
MNLQFLVAAPYRLKHLKTRNAIATNAFRDGFFVSPQGPDTALNFPKTLAETTAPMMLSSYSS